MATILVTGGAGFVGSHLCERLLDLGHDVTSLDNYFTGSIDNHAPGVKYIQGNTEDIDSLIDFIPDVVYHLGEYSRVEQSFDDISTVFNFNIQGTFAVLEFIKKTKAKLIYSGSSTKYADKTSGYVMSPYAWTKASNTDLVKQYGEWFGIDYAITYFYNVYGPREISDGKYATLIAKYTELAKLGAPLPVVLPGIQMRNFTHVDDIVDALILIGEHGRGDEYGIGNPNAYSVQSVARMFSNNVEYIPERKGNRMSAPVITDKTKSLGWEPKRELTDYISQLEQNGWNK